MSVIFKTLKKLKTQPTPVHETAEAFGPKPHVKNKSQFFFSSPLILTTLGILIVCVPLILYFLKSYIETRYPSQYSQKYAENTGNSTLKTISGSVELHSEKKQKNTSVPEDAAFPIEKNNRAEPQLLYAPQRTDALMHYIPKKTMHHKTTAPPDDVREDLSFQNNQPKNDPESKTSIQLNQKISKIKSRLPESKIEGPRFSIENPVNVERKKEEGRFLKESNAHHNNTAKTATITRMIQEMQNSIEQGDYPGAEKIVHKLEKYKHRDNNYLLKIKAFILIKNSDYESAAPLLQKVLNRNNNDFHANVNMAVIEANTNKIDAAKSRLLKLEALYSENTIIRELKKQME